MTYVIDALSEGQCSDFRGLLSDLELQKVRRTTEEPGILKHQYGVWKYSIPLKYILFWYILHVLQPCMSLVYFRDLTREAKNPSLFYGNIQEMTSQEWLHAPRKLQRRVKRYHIWKCVVSNTFNVEIAFLLLF